MQAFPTEIDERWMRLALELATEAESFGDVPVGAVVIGVDGEELSRGCNRRERDADPTAHAELFALREAARRVGVWRLSGCTVYTTLEPCPMCAGALLNARVTRVVFGCTDPKAGALHSLFSIGSDRRLNHTFSITSGILAEECADRLRRFFQKLRAAGEK